MYYKTNKYEADRLEMVNVDSLRVGLIDINSGHVSYILINKTPHYYFAKSIIDSEKKLDVGGSGYLNYNHYYEVNPKNASTPKQFIELTKKIIEDGYDFTNYPVLVYRHWSRPFPLRRLDVVDGFHRLAILAALGETEIMVCKLKYKHSFILRLINKLTNFFGID
jgi:hypothetical protein